MANRENKNPEHNTGNVNRVFIDKENISQETDLGHLSDEMTFRRYYMSIMNTRKIFSKMPIGNYVTLQIIEQLMKNEDGTNRIYLKDLVNKFHIPMHRMSDIVRDLSERGLVIWTHDGKGEEGTYIIITESGIQAAKEQQGILKEFYSNVIDQFGRDKFVQLLDLMAELDEVMTNELEEDDEDNA